MNVQVTFPQAMKVEGQPTHAQASHQPAYRTLEQRTEEILSNSLLFAGSTSSLQRGEGSGRKKTNDFFWGVGERGREEKARKEWLDGERGHWQGRC